MIKCLGYPYIQIFVRISPNFEVVFQEIFKLKPLSLRKNYLESNKKTYNVHNQIARKLLISST